MLLEQIISIKLIDGLRYQCLLQFAVGNGLSNCPFKVDEIFIYTTNIRSISELNGHGYFLNNISKRHGKRQRFSPLERADKIASKRTEQ